MSRCSWAEGSEIYQAYHDDEWGVPVYDDRKLFEFLVLESAQAGLSWITILKRREGYRRAFADFNPSVVATFDEAKVEELMQDTGIIRNRMKIESAIGNARAFLQIQEEFGTFSNYIWGFTGGKPIVNHFTNARELPAQTPLSIEIAKDLKKRGFRFLGPTVMYAHMQATGMVNDHYTSCFRHPDLVQKK
ncbi:MAG: DNA-3-methyladenine glycosylase I [Prolixibacteraceae bacterium]|nr:DNA-3-methyladenine glycosylase I [Prolixibacteraceae bacterium]